MENTCVGTRGLVGAVTVGSPTNTLSNKKRYPCGGRDFFPYDCSGKIGQWAEKIAT